MSLLLRKVSRRVVPCSSLRNYTSYRPPVPGQYRGGISPTASRMRPQFSPRSDPVSDLIEREDVPYYKYDRDYTANMFQKGQIAPDGWIPPMDDVQEDGSFYKLLFPEDEYEQRVAVAKAAMVEQGLDAIVIVDPANMNWVSGYDGWSFYVHQCLVLTLKDEQPVWIGRGMDSKGARLTAYMDNDKVVSYPDDFVQNFEKHTFDFVADYMKGMGLEDKRIGLEMDNYFFSAKSFMALNQGLPNAKFEDATALLQWCRIIKSERELEFMRQAARIAENVMRTAVNCIAPGVRQCDAAADIYHAGISGTEEFGGDYSAFVPLMPTGVDAAAAHLTWTSERFVQDRGTVLELSGVRHRYHIPIARTVFLGTPPQKFLDMEQVVIEGLTAALEECKTGTTAEEVHSVWMGVLNKYGLEKESRLGYSIGIGYPPDWGEHTVSIRQGDKTVLLENMTLHLIAGMWMEDWGLEMSESIRVTDTGAEPFCNFPRRIFVKP